MAWRHGDRWSSFTNGFQTWIDGPQGVQQRLDTQRFPWEANPDNLSLALPSGLPDAAITGKAIVVQLQAQTLTAYDHGAVALTTPVTTGRPYLATLVGQSAIYRRASPYLFVSPWPAGSIDWYPPSWVTWALEFRAGGYYIHDAPWEPAGAFGPGSENGLYASHGCVHVPTAAMRFLYGWAVDGTTVVVTN